MLRLLFCILFLSYSSEAYLINAEITGYPDGTKFYLGKITHDEFIDSNIIKNGKFTLSGTINEEPELFIITTEGIGQHYDGFYFGNDTISITGNIHQFPKNIKITGSKIQDEANELSSLTNNLYQQRMLLVKQYFELGTNEIQTKGKEIWDTISIIDKKYTQVTLDFIRKHPDSYISVIHLNYEMKNIPRDTLEYLFKRISENLKSFKYSKQLKIFLYDKIFDKGDFLLDFEAFNTAGFKVRLSDYFSDKLVLLDFTSLSCVPCKLSIKELKKLNTEFKKQLTVISFSTDPRKSDWQKSIERDKPDWENLWDGGGWQSETCMRYGITSVPSFVLFDKNKRILEKWTGFNDGSIFRRLEDYIAK